MKFNMNEKKITGEELISNLSYSFLVGDPTIPIEGPSPLGNAGPHTFSFCKLEGKPAVSLLAESGAGVVFVHRSLKHFELPVGARRVCYVGMENPRLEFIRCLNEYFTPAIEWGVHPTAVVDQDVRLPERIFIGPQAIIGKNVVLGDGSFIGPRAFVMNHSVIGKGVFVQAGAIIGCDGQGFERDSRGVLEKFPQMGRVALGDYVEIGSNSTIVRGALPGIDTVIGEGTKIGHLVDIGKNVKIGEQCLISAGVILCGSVDVGDHAWLAPGCVVRQKIRVGKGATIGLGAVVVNNVEDGSVVAGVPAKPLAK